MKIEFLPIGIIHTPFMELEGMPIQPPGAASVKGTVEVFENFRSGLKDLDGFSHIILLCHLHRARSHELTVVPYLDDQPRGLFSTRAPSRPNPIGLSVVRLLSVKGNTLEVADLDLLDGTPVLDIKPYVGEFDERTDARLGWLQAARDRKKSADTRFEE